MQAFVRLVGPICVTKDSLSTAFTRWLLAEGSLQYPQEGDVLMSVWIKSSVCAVCSFSASTLASHVSSSLPFYLPSM